ncbi:ATP-binding protein [Eremococcus coleocola]|uniref:ATP-binding protein n=1 Tax=Eremococcus coleocola TaxID=88132 RepID=UPI000428CEF2|nr:ATP-binding protein [Eremococcus coleocola]
MKRRTFHIFQSIYFKIPLLFLFILMVSFQFIGVFFIDKLENQSVNSFKSQINTQGDFLASNLIPILTDENLSEDDLTLRLDQTIDTFSSSNPTKIWVLNPNQTILATDQDIERTQVGAQYNNAAVQEVLLSRSSFAGEIDSNTRQPIYQLVKPIISNDSQVLGAIVIEASMEHIVTQTRDIIQLFLQSVLLAIVIAMTIAFFLSQGLTRPIENIRQQAIRIAEGVYDYPAHVFGKDELGELALTINELADKVKDAQESTESEKQRLDGVLRHMRDGVISTDRRGRVALVNDRALYLLNIYQEQAIGKSIVELLDLADDYSVHDLMFEDHEVKIEKTIKDIQTIIKAEFSVIRRDTGFVTGLVCVLTDVTEQEKTNQERRDFVSNVSHELRTPLTSVKSYSEALLDGALQDTSLAQPFLEVIQLESNRMIRMVSNLLDLSKIDGGQIILQKDLVDFKRVVDHIVDRMEFTLESGQRDKNYKIVRHYTPRDIYVDIDQDRMTQVIDNLINNAIKYSPDGGKITIGLEDNRDSVIFSVSDQGLGISQVDAEHLFERFYRVDKARSREQGGSGLGLAISKEVVELHGGRIWVESIEDEGSTFSFELPFTSMDELEGEWEEFE